MGSSCTIYHMRNAKALAVASALGVKDIVNGLYKNYRQIDVDDSGSISVHEFIVANGISCDMFGEIVFRLLDNDRSGDLSFVEYMIAVWNFCSLDRDSLAAFTFQIFDTDGSGKVVKVVSFIYICFPIDFSPRISYTRRDHLYGGSFMGFPTKWSVQVRPVSFGHQWRRTCVIRWVVSPTTISPQFQWLRHCIAVEFIHKSVQFPIMCFPAFEMQEILKGLHLDEVGGGANPRTLFLKFQVLSLAAPNGKVLRMKDQKFLANKQSSK